MNDTRSFEQDKASVFNKINGFRAFQAREIYDIKIFELVSFR